MPSSSSPAFTIPQRCPVPTRNAHIAHIALPVCALSVRRRTRTASLRWVHLASATLPPCANLLASLPAADQLVLQLLTRQYPATASGPTAAVVVMRDVTWQSGMMSHLPPGEPAPATTPARLCFPAPLLQSVCIARSVLVLVQCQLCCNMTAPSKHAPLPSATRRSTTRSPSMSSSGCCL